MKFSTLFIAALLALVTVLPLSGQIVPCPLGDDGFNTGCCITPLPNLPQFPTITETGLYGCIKDCALEAQFNYSVTIQHQWVLCDYAVINITATPAAAIAPTLTTQQFAKYSRTFMEVDTTGVTRQVWRFLLNGDMVYGPTPASAVPCPVPPDVAAGIPTHMNGSIDYICGPNTTTQPYKVRLNLNHWNGCWSHAGFSTYPLAGAAAHTDRSYHLVAPSNFVFAPVPDAQGPIVADAIRPSIMNWMPFNYTCRSEETVQQGQLQTLNMYCGSCGPAPAAAPPIFSDQNLSGVAVCAGAAAPFSTVPIPGLMPGGMVTMAVGFWTPTTPIGTPTDLLIHIGFMQYTDLCTGDGPFHVVAGVTTRNFGAPALLFPNPAFPTNPGPHAVSMDLGNVKILPLFPPYTLPSPTPYLGWGSLYLSDLVFNLNLP